MNGSASYMHLLNKLTFSHNCSMLSAPIDPCLDDLSERTAMFCRFIFNQEPNVQLTIDMFHAYPDLSLNGLFKEGKRL